MPQQIEVAGMVRLSQSTHLGHGLNLEKYLSESDATSRRRVSFPFLPTFLFVFGVFLFGWKVHFHPRDCSYTGPLAVFWGASRILVCIL